MAEGIDLDGGGVDMYPDDTDRVMTTLDAAGHLFGTSWNAKLGEIAALDCQLGKGPLGRPMARKYIPAVKQIVDALDELGRRVSTRASFGHQAVRQYVEADQSGAQSFDF